MDTEVDVPNPKLVLIPGMFAEVDLTLSHRNGVLSVPIPAVDLGSDQSSGQVVVVTPENRIEIRKVQLGITRCKQYRNPIWLARRGTGGDK